MSDRDEFRVRTGRRSPSRKKPASPGPVSEVNDHGSWLLSLRMYLLIKAMESGATYFEAAEAVSTTLLSKSYPDVALRTYMEWEERAQGESR